MPWRPRSSLWLCPRVQLRPAGKHESKKSGRLARGCAFAVALLGMADRPQRIAEEVRDEMRWASDVHAWIARSEKTGERCVVVTSSTSGVIYGNHVDLLLDGQQERAPRRQCWNILPPGTYVIDPDAKYKWDLPRPIGGFRDYVPYTRSDKHIVTALTFTDPSGPRWTRAQTGQLLRLVEDPAQRAKRRLYGALTKTSVGFSRRAPSPPPGMPGMSSEHLPTHL